MKAPRILQDNEQTKGSPKAGWIAVAAAGAIMLGAVVYGIIRDKKEEKEKNE